MTKIDCLKGYPSCPICGATLKVRDMPGAGESRWYCPVCGSTWETPGLIADLNVDETTPDSEPEDSVNYA